MPPVNHVRLRERRDELDLSNGEVAERMATSLRYVENILMGYDRPGMRVVHRLARALALPVEEILVGETPQGDPSEPPKQPKQPPKKQGRSEPAGTGPKRNQPEAAAS